MPKVFRPKILIPIGAALLLIVSAAVVLYLRAYLPTHTKSYFTDFSQYAPSYLPKNAILTRGEITVVPRKSAPGQYLKMLMFSAGSSLQFEEEKDGEISPLSYRLSCANIPKGFVDACDDETSPGGQKYVYTDYTYSLGTTVVIVSWRKGDTYLSVMSTDPTIESSEYAKIIDSMHPAVFSHAQINVQ